LIEGVGAREEVLDTTQSRVLFAILDVSGLDKEGLSVIEQ
jgi:hypothetical protein